MNLVASSRTVSGALVGISQARPHARGGGDGDQGAGTSPIVVQVCGTSRFAGTNTALPGKHRLRQHEAEDRVGLDVVARAHLGRADASSRVCGERVAPHVGAQFSFGCVAASGVVSVIGPSTRPYAVDVAGDSQHRAARSAATSSACASGGQSMSQ